MEMDAAWRQVLAVSVAAVIVGSLGVLMAHRAVVESDVASAMPSASATDGQAASWKDFLVKQGELLSLELGPPLDWEPGVASRLSEAIQADRMTVLEVDQGARRIVAVNGQGRVRAADVAAEAVVVTPDRNAPDLALVSPGDVIKAERSGGRILKIVVLRHAWNEMASPE